MAEGRKFGLSVGIAFLILCGLLTWRGHLELATATGILGGLLVMAGLLLPSRLEPVHRVWMAGAMAISRVTTPLFMGLVYFLVITPSGWLRRTVGSNPLRREETEGGFWVRRDTSGSDLTRQF